MSTAMTVTVVIAPGQATTDHQPALMTIEGQTRRFDRVVVGPTSAEDLASDWVVWSTADDRFETRWLEAVCERLAAERPPDLLVTNGRWRRDGAAGERFYGEHHRFPTQHQREAILRGNFLLGPVVARGSSNVRTARWDTWITLILDGAIVALDDEPLVTRLINATTGDVDSDTSLLLVALQHPRLLASEREVVIRTLGGRSEQPASHAASVARPAHDRGGEEPTVTVVLPFFNEERFLADAVATVAAQTVSSWELLLVDDGSTDGSGELARRIADGDRRIRVLGHADSRNHGLASSRELGLRQARGKLLAFLDADDRWVPEKLQRQIDLLAEQPRAAMVCGPTWHRTLDDAGPGNVVPVAQRAPVLYRRGRFARDLVCGRLVGSPPPSNVLHRRDALIAAGGVPPGDSLYEDQRTYVAVSLRDPVFVADQPLSTYMVRDDSLYGSVKRDVATQLEQRRAFERWIVHHGIGRGGVHGLLLVARLVAHRVRRGVARRSRQRLAAWRAR